MGSQHRVVEVSEKWTGGFNCNHSCGIIDYISLETGEIVLHAENLPGMYNQGVHRERDGEGWHLELNDDYPRFTIPGNLFAIVGEAGFDPVVVGRDIELTIDLAKSEHLARFQEVFQGELRGTAEKVGDTSGKVYTIAYSTGLGPFINQLNQAHSGDTNGRYMLVNTLPTQEIVRKAMAKQGLPTEEWLAKLGDKTRDWVETIAGGEQVPVGVAARQQKAAELQTAQFEVLGWHGKTAYARFLDHPELLICTMYFTEPQHCLDAYNVFFTETISPVPRPLERTGSIHVYGRDYQREELVSRWLPEFKKKSIQRAVARMRLV